MKLELKHLAPYLPYGLKCMYGCIMDVKNDHIETMNENNIQKVLNGYGTFVIQPILRPLSDLNSDNADFLSSDGYMAVCEECVYIDEMRYSDVEELIKRHYDVFGLIPQGLAISCNDL